MSLWATSLGTLWAARAAAGEVVHPSWRSWSSRLHPPCLNPELSDVCSRAQFINILSHLWNTFKGIFNIAFI